MTDKERLDWLADNLFERKWMPPIGTPHFWRLVPRYRHFIQDMNAADFRSALDLAISRWEHRNELQEEKEIFKILVKMTGQ